MHISACSIHWKWIPLQNISYVCILALSNQILHYSHGLGYTKCKRRRHVNATIHLFIISFRKVKNTIDISVEFISKCTGGIVLSISHIKKKAKFFSCLLFVSCILGLCVFVWVCVGERIWAVPCFQSLLLTCYFINYLSLFRYM